MSKKADLIKKMIKTNVGQKPTYGTDPNDPWSAKAGITEDTINETALLNRYLKSRGINPEFVSKDQKVAHSKTNQFKVWMNAHINDPVKESVSQEHTPTEKRSHVLKRALHVNKEIRVTDGHKQLHSEAVDKKDTITFDIPLLIRVLEFAREDLKSDILLHKMVERLIAIRGKGTLTMNQYGRIVKEEAESLGESYGDRVDKLLAYSHSMHQQARKETDPTKKATLSSKGSKAHKVFLKARDRNIAKDPEAHARKMQSGATQDFKDQEAKRGIGHVRDHVEVEGDQLDETWKYHTYSSNEAARAAVKAHHEYRDEKGMASGNPARAMGNGKVAYKGEFKGPKPTKSVSEAKEANYGGDYQASVLRVKELAKKKPVDMKSLAARMQAAYAKEDEKKPVKEGVVDKLKKFMYGDPKDGPRKTMGLHASLEKHADDKMKEIGHKLRPSVKKEETVDEAKLPSNLVWTGGRVQKDPAVVAGNKRKKNYQAYLRRKAAKEKTPVEESLEPMAACNQPGDGANTPDDVAPSKAKKVKLLLGDKKKPVTEEMYDHEKEDKSVATPGKKVKVDKPQQDSITKEQPPAAAILSGGKTMTGETRDTIEIDPMMKLKKPSPDSQKSV